MKKLFFPSIFGGLALLAFVNIGTAQENTYTELPPVTITASTPSATVNAKVTKAFSKLYKDATNARWFPIEKKFLVKFIMKDQDNTALFTKGGNLVYHISYGAEKNLPKEVRHIIKSSYYDQKINHVYNVEQDNRSIWVVSLDDAKELIMVRVENNELEETQRYAKSK